MSVTTTTACTPGNKTKRFCYDTWVEEIHSYELEWRLTNYDITRQTHLVLQFNPHVTPVEYITTKTLSWRIKIFNPNEEEENVCRQIKSDELGYIISFRRLSKEDCHVLAARVHTSMFNLDSGEEELLCSEKFIESDISCNDAKEYHFDTRKLPYDESLQVQKLLIKVTIKLFSDKIMKTGCEKLSPKEKNYQLS